MENLDFNWILLGVTATLTLFIAYVRVSEYRKHNMALAEFKENEKNIEVIYESKKNIVLYLWMAALIFVVSFFAGNSLLEKIAMAIMFTILILTELLNAIMMSKLYASSRAFLYGVDSHRFRSIRKVEEKGKKDMKLLMINKEECVLPKAYASALQEHMKTIKAAKK